MTTEWRRLNKGEEVLITTEGRSPGADGKTGVVTGGYRLKAGGNNQYEIYIPELNKTYWIALTYLTPTKNPTKAQQERYRQRAAATALKQTPEYKQQYKKFLKLQREALKLRKEGNHLLAAIRRDEAWAARHELYKIAAPTASLSLRE
jgi:hypothetical protein